MKTRLYLIVMILAGLLLSVQSVAAAPLRQGGSPIQIWWGSLDEDNPATAYSTSSQQYLVVYEVQGVSGRNNIGFTYLNSHGQVLSSGMVSYADGTNQGHPDVVYDPSTNRFLVVWDEYDCAPFSSDCGYVIKGRLLYGSTSSNFPGNTFFVANGISSISAGNDLCDPAVAFNDDQGQFQIVYLRRVGADNEENCTLRDHDSLYGQMAGSSWTTPSTQFSGIGFGVAGTYSVVRDPDIAWASGGNRFLAVFEGEDRIRVKYLFDTNQGGSQLEGNTIYITPYGPVTGDCYTPAVAYDPVANRFVVVYAHKEDLVSRSIYAQRLSSTYSTSAPSPFAIETTLGTIYSRHDEPDITFSGRNNDEMHIVYRSYKIPSGGFSANEYWIYDRTLNGSTVGNRLVLYHSTVSETRTKQQSPAVACSTAQCLAAWEDFSLSTYWDISGRVWPAYNYLPFVIK